ncbi:TPA: putative DNA-binding domain-containing protein [Klebsiella aerogenes]
MNILSTEEVVNSHHSVPEILVTAESSFSSSLRAKSARDEKKSSGIFIYREIVRGNIHGVLQSVFPLFCLCLHETVTHELVNEFIYQHHASQPEFHQIATELLLFIRQQGGFSANDLALLEYEWLLYAVEIDDNDVPAPQKISLRSAERHNIAVILNPTLKIVALPFYIREGGQEYEQSACLHYYVIYRKYNNCLYRKKVTPLDIQLLYQIKDDVTLGGLFQDQKIEPGIPLTKWLENNINEEVLFLNRKK